MGGEEDGMEMRGHIAWPNLSGSRAEGVETIFSQVAMLKKLHCKYAGILLFQAAVRRGDRGILAVSRTWQAGRANQVLRRC